MTVIEHQKFEKFGLDPGRVESGVFLKEEEEENCSSHPGKNKAYRTMLSTETETSPYISTIQIAYAWKQIHKTMWKEMTK